MGNIFDMSELTPKQSLFVLEYLKDLNASRAYRAAGYAEKNADVCSSQLLVNPKIAAAVKVAMDERAERTKVTVDRVVTELARIGFADIRKIVAWDGNSVRVRPADELTPDDAACIAEIQELVTEGEKSSSRNLKIKLHSKEAALTKLGDHLGMYRTIVEARVAAVPAADLSSMSDAEISAAAARRLIAHASGD